MVSEHQGVKFKCPSCDHVTKYFSSMRKHLMKVHKFDGNAVHESAAFYNRDFTNGELIKLRLDENGKVQFPRCHHTSKF